MKTADHIDALSDVTQPIVLAAGMFDGVHLGHTALLSEAQRQAKRWNGEAWVFTFSDHPQRILAPAQAPPLLTTPIQKRALFELQGMDGCLMVPFTRELSQMEPEKFISQLHETIPSLQGLVVGRNWRFGYRARGDIQILQKLGENYGLEIILPDAITWQGAVISSTRIRDAIIQGNMDDAKAMLGRSPSYEGTVIHGLKRGRKLGFPTANLDIQNVLRPAPGIYAGWAIANGTRFKAAAYLPLVQREHPAAVEVHLLDTTQDLYGENLRIELVRRLREDTMRFEHEAELKEQIRQDVEHVRQILNQQEPDETI